jgi:hypothetical protein
MRQLGVGLVVGALSLVFVPLLGGCGGGGDGFGDGADEGTSQALTPSPPFYGDPQNGAVFAIDISMWEGPMAQAEMDCFWASGVRHVVAGTQIEEVTRQQLAMAVKRGMSVDAYVYLYWNQDMKAQVDEAFRRVKGFPIGRMWLDVEEAPGSLGWKTISQKIDEAKAACAAQGTAGCGIYTGPGFWKTYMANTTQQSDLPLWYAQYNGRKLLSDWSTERFGGWAKPAAKQWAEEALCGVGVDKDTMQTVVPPQVVVDRTLPADTKQPPPAPTGLYPADGSVVGIDHVKLMVDTIPRATRYELALEKWTGTEWRPWYTWTSVDGFRKTQPATNALYRFRARAMNAYGWGPWSAYATFDYGKYAGPRPGASPPPQPTQPPPPPPPPGVPGMLSPDGATLSTAGVTLSCGAVGSAASYEFAIEYLSGGSYVTYASYAGAAPSRTFYPTVRGTTYRWRVRAKTGTTWGAWSSWATFQFK